MRPLLKLTAGILAWAALGAGSAHALEVKSWSCESETGYINTCKIQLQGKVTADDLIRMDDLGDTDQLYYKDQLLGKTGFYLNYIFYARFVPRVYSLEKLVGVESPVLTLKVQSLLGPDAGIGEKTRLRIINKDSRQASVVLALLWRLVAVFAAGMLLAYLPWFLRMEVKDGWAWRRSHLFAFYLSTTLFLFSLTEVPRIIIPTLMSGEQYFLVHGLITLICLWSLGRLLGDAIFIDTSAVEKIRQRNHQLDSWIGKIINAGFVIAVAILVLKVEGGFKRSHSLAFLLLAMALGSVALLRISRAVHRRIWQRSRLTPMLFFYGQMICALLLFWGGAEYAFHQRSMHWPSVIGLLATLSFALARKLRYQSLIMTSMDFVSYCRSELRQGGNGHSRIETLCRIVQERWDAARVSIVSIRGDQALLLASRGPAALEVNPDDSHTTMGPFMKRVARERHMLYAPVAQELGRDLSEQGLKFGTIALPFLSGDRVEAVLFVMAHEGARLSPQDAAMLGHAADMMELEILSAIQQTVSEEQVQHLRNITAASSGIVLERMDAWGRLPEVSEEFRRIILTADGINSTVADAAASSSPLVWNALMAYKRELYAVWFALRTVFEFLSKDVRGDDFWAVSPGEFKNPILKALGPERCGLILASLIEKHARAIAQSDEYRMLGSPGAHVALGAAQLKLVTLGIDASKCLDVDSPKMSELCRIRSEAMAGSVLVDVGDSQMAEALQDKEFFRAENYLFDYGKKSIFKGLQQHPNVRSLTALITERKEIRKLEAQAMELARETLQKQKAA